MEAKILLELAMLGLEVGLVVSFLAMVVLIVVRSNPRKDDDQVSD